MATNHEANTALSDVAALQLANATKTTAQLSTISPRWLVHLLQWLPVEAGIYASPLDARWTSFPATVGLTRAPMHLRVDAILDRFGDDVHVARQRFVDFVLTAGSNDGTALAVRPGSAIAA